MNYLDVQLIRDLDPMVDNGGGLVQAHEGVRQRRVERLHLNIRII